MLPDQAQQFLQHHGGDAAVEHKAELLQLSGGNVGKLEALGVKRGACALQSLSSLAGARQEPENPELRAGPAGSPGRAGRVCFCTLVLRTFFFFLPCARSRRSYASSASMPRAASAQKRSGPPRRWPAAWRTPHLTSASGPKTSWHVSPASPSTGSEGARRPLHLCKGHH